MNQINFLFSPVAQALGHTILYSIGQAFIVFISLRILIKIIPDVSARARYYILYFSYAGIALWFLITLIRQFLIAQSDTIYQQIAGSYSFLNKPFEQTTTAVSSILSLSFADKYLPWLVGFYLVGLFWYSLRFSINLFQTNRLKRKGLFELDSDWQRHIARLSEKMNITRPLKTFFSSQVNTPLMIGFLKPVILLPVALMNHLSPQQFEAILLHELAHIRRNDYFLNIVQSLIDTILFFNPFSWWITNKIREERENCCDEMVLQLSDPYHYAHALLALEHPLQNSPLAMAAIGKRSHLFYRIKKIIEMKNNPFNARQKFITFLILVMATVSVAWLSPSKNTIVITEHQKMMLNESQAATPFSTFLNFKVFPDSVPKKIAPMPPPPPPVAMRQNAAPPMPPLPPFPPVPSITPSAPPPPPPPLSGLSDSLPPSTSFFNSQEWKQQRDAIKKSTDEMRKYFQSDAWKKQQNFMKENTAAIQKYFNSPEWKKHQEEIRHEADSLTTFFKSDAWQKQQDMRRKIAEEMKQFYTSPEWKKQEGLIKKNAEEMEKHFNSLEWKKQIELMKKNQDFNNKEWKTQLELMKKNGEEMKKYFNSPEWKKQQEEIQHAADSLSAPENNKP